MARSSGMYGFSQFANDAPSQDREQTLHPEGLSIRTEWLEDKRASVVYATGNVDWTTSHDLRFEIARCLAVDHPSQLIIDLGAVNRVDSSGLGTLMESRQNAAQSGVHFTLCGVSTALRRVLERIRLDSIFEIRATPYDALRNSRVPKSKSNW